METRSEFELGFEDLPDVVHPTFAVVTVGGWRGRSGRLWEADSYGLHLVSLAASLCQ